MLPNAVFKLDVTLIKCIPYELMKVGKRCKTLDKLED